MHASAININYWPLYHQFLLLQRLLHLLLLMLIKFWLSPTRQTLSVLQCRLLPVSNMRWVLQNGKSLWQSEELSPQVSSQPWWKYSQRVSTATDGRLFGFCLLWRLMTTFSLWLFWRLLVGTERNSWATKSIENGHEALATKYRCVGISKKLVIIIKTFGQVETNGIYKK